MVSINYATREVSCKIVYYGPGLSGKTTNLQYVHLKVPSDTKGKLISLATDADRTLYFDFLPINIGAINGFAAKFQLYTVPGQVYYNATRKLVLRGVDGLVFVADSQHDKMDENIESFNNLKENLAEYGYKLDEIPIVIQYNKQDLPEVMTPEEMRPILNTHNWQEFKASATEGFGVFDTLKCILKLVLEKAKTGGTVPSTERPAAVQAEQAPAPPPASEPAAAVAQPAAVSPSPPPPPTPAAQPVMAEPVAQGQYAADDSSATPAEGIPIPPPPPPPAAEIPPPDEPLVRESVGEITPPKSKSEYRPFPGNTAEDEIKMRQVRRPEVPSVSQPEQVTAADRPYADSTTVPDAHQQSITNSSPAGLPRMEPSLKAETPRKKRSFFKRLFGLK